MIHENIYSPGISKFNLFICSQRWIFLWRKIKTAAISLKFKTSLNWKILLFSNKCTSTQLIFCKYWKPNLPKFMKQVPLICNAVIYLFIYFHFYSSTDKIKKQFKLLIKSVRKTSVLCAWIWALMCLRFFTSKIQWLRSFWRKHFSLNNVCTSGILLGALKCLPDAFLEWIF